MAFSIRELSVMAYANGFTLWHYKSLFQSLADVRKANFFVDAIDMMAAGDMILISAKDGGGLSVVTEVKDNVILTPIS